MDKKLLDWQGVAERCGGISKSLVDDLDSKGELGPVIQHGDGKNSKRFWQESEVEAYLKSRENSSQKDPVQEAFDKLKKLKLDHERFPVKDYEHYLPKLNDWTVHIRTFIGGDVSWYEQKNIIAGIKRYLGQIEFACRLFGRLEAAVVMGICDSLKSKIITLLGSNPMDDSRKIIYPTLANDQSLYAIQNNLHLGWLVEMNYEFFNLGDDQQLELKNLSKQDILYNSELFGLGNDNRFRYRIPAEGTWTSIPPFEPDTRPDSGTPGRFTSARELFNHRQELQIRVICKFNSQPPICMADELEMEKMKAIVAETEIKALIKTIKSGE